MKRNKVEMLHKWKKEAGKDQVLELVAGTMVFNKGRPTFDFLQPFFVQTETKDGSGYTIAF